MAYVSNSATEYYDVASSSITVDLPAHETGDLLLIHVVNDVGGTELATSSSGWTQYGSDVNALGVRTAWFYKVAASSSEANPVITGRNDEWMASTLVIKDFDSADIFNGSVNKTETNSKSYAFDTFATDENDVLVIYAASSDRQTDMIFEGGGAVVDVYNANTGLTSIIGHKQQFTASTTEAIKVRNRIASEGAHLWTIGINNATSGSRDIDVDTHYEPVFMGGDYEDFTVVGPTGITGLTAINGITIHNVAVSEGVALSELGVPFGYVQSLSNTDTTADRWHGEIFNIGGSVDISGNNRVISYYHNPISSRDVRRFGDEGFIFLLIDSLNNWIAYQLDSYETYVQDSTNTHLIDLDQVTAYDESATAVDFSDITYFGVFVHKGPSSSLNTQWRFGNCASLKELVVKGGSESVPINLVKISELANANRFTGLSATQGVAQGVFGIPVQLGDGTSPTYVDFRVNSSEVFKNSRIKDLGNNAVDFEVYGSANCNFNLSSAIFSTDTENTFTINASSSSSATYNFESTIFTGYSVVNNATGVDIDSAAFVETRGITLNGGSLSNCAIRRSVGTAVTTNDPSNITNCAFTSAGTGHAIEITAAGTYDFTGNSFSGYGADGTTDAAIYNNSGGAVTLTLSAGDAAPTVRNGTGASTTINTPTVDITAPNLIDGTRVLLRNDTANTTIDNSVVSGAGGYSYTTSSGDASDGDVIKLFATYQSGTSAKQELELLGTFSSTGVSFPNSQVDLIEYATIGIDGSTVTEFTADGINVQVDIDDPDGQTTKDRFIAWWFYNLTTSSGIATYFGGLTVEDASNFKVNASVVDLKLDNVSGSPLVFTDAKRLYRDDGETIVASSSDSIQLDAGKVFIAETGVSGLTASESSQLAEISTINTKVDTIDTNVDAILVDTSTTLPAQISALSFPSASDVADAVWDETSSDHVSSGSTGEKLRNAARDAATALGLSA